MKKIILIFILVPIIILSQEKSLLDSYKNGYDDGRKFAQKNKLEYTKVISKKGVDCLPIFLTDAVMGFLIPATAVIFSATIINNDSISEDNIRSVLLGMVVWAELELVFFRGMNCYIGMNRCADEFDILKIKTEFPNASYKAGFIDGAKALYNKKFRF
jgi:hypothetical protein